MIFRCSDDVKEKSRKRLVSLIEEKLEEKLTEP